MYKIDFAMSDDGDLVLGSPRTDENNKILYRHADGAIDTDQGADGKPLLDMAYSVGRDAYKQIILARLKTDAPDWYHHPEMGGNLSDLIGMPNTKETGDLGAQYIFSALTYGGFLHPGQIAVRPIPVSEKEILFMITIQISEDDSFQIPLIFDLSHGLKEV